MPVVTKDFTANTQSSDVVRAKDETLIALSIDMETGTGVGTVDVMRKIGQGAWKAIESHSASVEKNIEAVTSDCAYRLDTSAYTSGTIASNMAYID